jgi:hypothetical protein
MADAQNNQGPSNAAGTVLPGGNGNTGGQNFTVGGPSDPNFGSTISSATLTPQAPISYSTTSPTAVPDISGLGYNPTTDTLSETPAQKQESTLTGNIETLNNEMVNKSADTNAAYKTAGFTVDANGNPTNQTLTDLNNQITYLKNQAAAIPQQLQTDASGRGITAAGLGSIQSAALRNNAVAALGVSSTAEALKNNLGTAKLLADQAISAKYDPIQAQIDAATKNLDLIKNDPNTTLQEQNQANAQKAALAQKQAALDQQKTDAANVMNVAITAAKNGADAATLQKIQQAPDGETALSIAASAWFGNSNIQDLMTKYPDAGIQPGDSLQTAQNKVMQSPTYTMAQKTAMLDILTKEQALKNAGGGGGTVSVDNGQGGTVDVPVDVAPYYNTSTNGTSYVDASALQGTAADKKSIITQATNSGLKVITNKNEAADLTNIQDANSKLDSISQIMTGIDQPNVLSRIFNNIGFTQGAVLLQTNPQQAAASSLQAVGLDMLKAISGIQGFRGNTTVVQQINDHMPTIYDTDAVAQQKIDYIRQLITDRENSILGTSKSSSQTYNGVTLPADTSSSGSTYNGITLPN